MALFRKNPKPDEDPDALTEQGMEKLQEGDARGAIAAFAAAVKINPQHAQAWYGKGCAHGELEEDQLAIEAYKQSAKYAGDRAGLPLYNLGNTYQRLEQYQEAAECFHQATQVDPTMADAWINLGRLLDDSGQHEAAVECYDKALESEPADVVAWSNRGNSLRSLGKSKEALESYRKALELDGDDVAARIGIGPCLLDCGQIEEGLEALQSAVEDTRHPMALFEFATALAKVDQHEAAVTFYDTLIENDFVSAEIFNNRGECLAKLDRIDESLESFDKAIEFDEEFAPAWFGKARVLVNANRVNEARPAAKRYAELASEEERSEPAAQALLKMCGL